MKLTAAIPISQEPTRRLPSAACSLLCPAALIVMTAHPLRAITDARRSGGIAAVGDAITSSPGSSRGIGARRRDRPEIAEPIIEGAADQGVVPAIQPCS